MSVRGGPIPVTKQHFPSEFKRDLWTPATPARVSFSDRLRRKKSHILFSVLRAFNKEIRFRRGGFLWTGAPDCEVTRDLFVSGYYQQDPLAELVPFLERHTDFSRPWIVNVGANIGDVALPLSRTGKRILAIEPHPETFGRLTRNVRQNGLEHRIACCECAIAASEGHASLAVASDPGSSEIVGEGGRVGFDGIVHRQRTVEVKTARLDALIARHGIRPDEVALVWSDTQGYEAQVVSSGAELWRRGAPLWVEIWPRGLACHGGAESFLQVCADQFKRAVLSGQMERGPLCIDILRTVVDQLPPGDYTDALLMV